MDDEDVPYVRLECQHSLNGLKTFQSIARKREESAANDRLWVPGGGEIDIRQVRFFRCLRPLAFFAETT